MVIRRYHKLENSALNASSMDKAIDKELEHGWELNLKIDSIRHTKKSGVIHLGVTEQLSINKKVESYTERCVTHDCSFPGVSDLSMKPDC